MLLKTKALLGGGSLLLVVGVGSGVLLASNAAAAASTRKVETVDVPLQQAVAHAVQDFYSYDDQNNMYVLVAVNTPKNTTLWRSTHDQAVTAQQALRADIAAARRLVPPASPAAGLLDRIGHDLDGYDATFTTGWNAALAGHYPAAAYQVTIANLTPSNDLMPALADLGKIADTAAAQSLATVKAGQARADTVAIALAAAVIAELAMLTVLFGRQVLRPIDRVRRRMLMISQAGGDLTQRLAMPGNDEVAQLAHAVDATLDTMQTFVREVADSASTLATQSDQLLTASTAIVAAADETSSQAEQVTATAGAVATSVATVADSTEQLTSAIREISTNAANATGVASQAADTAGEAGHTVERLSDSAGQISQVLSLITAVAEQTNLLALNATIEAARAGDAGKGFAVVATEVKELAAQSGRAATDIANRVESLQDVTRGTSTAILQISDVVASINDYQTTIASAVEEQVATTADIAGHISVASTNTRQILDAMHDVTTAATTTANHAAASESGARRLAELSRTLTRLVAGYTT